MSFIKQFFFTAVLLLWIGDVTADPEMVFHAPFDKDFSATMNGKIVQGQHSQQVLFETLATWLQPGVAGKAALIGRPENNLANHYGITYKGTDIINPQQGAVSFWLSPQDWKASDNKFHIFIEASGQNSFLVIYKYLEGSDLFFLYGAKQGRSKEEIPWTVAKKNIRDWEMKKWHFITCCWNEQKIWLYIDGLIADTRPVRLSPTTPFPSVVVGGSFDGWKTDMGRTLIDDVKIFNAPLTAQQVAALHGSYNFQKAAQTDKPLTFSKVFPSTDRADKVLKLSFLLSRFQPDFKPYKVNFELLDSSKKVVMQKTIISSDTEYNEKINVAALAPGRYLARISPVAVKDEKCPVAEFDYAIPADPPAWDSNQCGISDKVPPPWTDMKLLPDNTVECWGRQYVFNNSLFPSQIKTGKYSLLNDPVRLTVGGKVFDAPCGIKVTKESPAAIELECTGKNEQMSVKTSITVEYDGFMWVKMDILPEKAFTVNAMTLDIPLKNDCASLFNLMRKYYMENEKGFVGAVTDKTISANLYQFNPVIWLGNEDVGLEWFTENLKGWHNKDKASSLQIVSSGNARILRLNLIDSSVELKQPRHIEFGLQATPVRPLLKDWRKLRSGRNIEMWFPWAKIHNVPDAEFKKPDYEQQKKSMSVNGKKVFHYFATYTMSPHFPEWPWWCDLWSRMPPLPGTYIDPDDHEWGAAYTCVNAGSLRDFYAWKFKQAQKVLDIKCIYVDNQCSQRCRNAAHGCGWTDDSGELYDTWNILGTRQLAKRMYTMIKEYDPQGMVTRHMSAQMVTPVVGFADILVDGELYMGTVGKDESYFNIFTPDMFRASFMTRQFGIPDQFIPQFERAFQNHYPEKTALWKSGKIPDMDKKIRHFKGYFFVHDARIWPLFGVKLDDYWKIEDDFKISDETPFFGYWDKNNPFKLENQSSDREMVSAYVDQGKFMLVAMNDTDNIKQMKIKMDMDKLSKSAIAGNVKLTNPETKAGIEVSGDTVNLELKPRDYQIWIYKQQNTGK
ncbi:MAG: glycoside hydrolase domain-containing protein [Victivallaceae bacterium]|jgi:hypothetical protein